MRFGPECKKIGKKGCGAGKSLLYYPVKLPDGPVSAVRAGRLLPERFRRFGKLGRKGRTVCRRSFDCAVPFPFLPGTIIVPNSGGTAVDHGNASFFGLTQEVYKSMSEKIDYSKGIYDARQLGAGRMFILGVQHMFAMFGAPCWCRCSQA